LSEELQTIMGLILSLLSKYPQFWSDLDKVIVAPEVTEEEAGIKFAFVRKIRKKEGVERARAYLVRMVRGIAKTFEPELPMEDDAIVVRLTKEEKEYLRGVFE